MIAVMAITALAADQAPRTDFKRDAVKTFATCVRRRARDRANALLATEPGSDAEKKEALVIAGAYNACIVGRQFLSFPVELLRGQLAELAFQDNAGLRDKAAALQGAAPIRPDVASIDKDVSKIPADRRDQGFTDKFRVAYARCVANADPKAVAAIIPTASATAEERETLMTASETLRHCMPDGITYHLNSAELRPYLMSELYYRAVTGARPGA